MQRRNLLGTAAATAAAGIGGAASAGLVNVAISASNLALAGESVIQSDATGGAGGATGDGGAASAGPAMRTAATAAIEAALVDGLLGIADLG